MNNYFGSNDKKLLERIIGINGINTIVDIAVEEHLELSEVLLKYKRGMYDREHLIEELADCAIMEEQLKAVFGISDEDIAKKVSFKLDRTITRLEHGYK